MYKPGDFIEYIYSDETIIFRINRLNLGNYVLVSLNDGINLELSTSWVHKHMRLSPVYNRKVFKYIANRQLD